MKIKKIFIGFLVLFTFLLSSQAFAAGTISVSTKGPALAYVGLGDYSIVSQENNKIVISFNISNQGEVQSGVKYGIKLVKEIGKSQFLADEKVYDESLTLVSGANLKKEITYIAPSNLDGEYGILLTSRNEGGLVFGMSYVGKVKLVSSTKGILISPETCNLSIPGEKNKYIKYNLLEGVDISTTESLQLNCSAINTDSKSITATPTFETHYRTVYGAIVPHTDVVNAPITFNAGEKKDISILLPKATKSQAYDVKVSFDYGNEKSNTIIAHYVIQGVSATIQNLSLDKDFYEKGETANMFFSWTQSADGFPGSRLGKASLMPEVYANATITNKYGLNCIDPVKQLLPTDHNTLKNDVAAPVKRTCVDPKVTITLTDKDGNMLDQKDFNVETSTREKSPLNTNIIIAIVILALIIVLVLVYIKNKKGKNGGNSSSQINVPVAIFIALFTLVSVGIDFPVFKASAKYDILMAVNGGGSSSGSDGSTVTTTSSTGTAPTGLAATLSFNKTSYDPGTTAQLTTSLYYTGCTNVTRNLVATGVITGGSYTGTNLELFNTTVQGLVGNTQNTNITVPSTPGDYTLNMTIKGYTPISYELPTTESTITGTDFIQFKNAITEYLYDTDSQFASDHAGEIYNAENIGQLKSAINQSPLFLIPSQYGGELSFTREYTFSPIKVPGVTIYANNQRDITPVTPVSYGNNVEVEWHPISSATCDCTCINKDTQAVVNCGSTLSSSCGSGIGSGAPAVQRSTPYPIPGVKSTTTFKVHCE